LTTKPGSCGFASQIAGDVRADEQLTAQILDRYGRRQARAR
jgi:hypothetical protein